MVYIGQYTARLIDPHKPAHAEGNDHHEEPTASVSSRIKAFSSSHHSPTPSHDAGHGGAGSRGSLSQVKVRGKRSVADVWVLIILSARIEIRRR